MHLYELAVGVIRALLIQGRLRRSGADHRVGGLAEDCADAARADDHGVAREDVDFHRAQVHSADAAADSVAIQHCAQELPMFVLGNAAVSFVAAHLFIERIKKLLPGGGAGKSRTVVERASEATEVEQPFRGTVEGDAHTVKQINDPGCGLAHITHRRLVGKEVATIDGVVKVQGGGVAFALQILGCVDAALRTHRMRALHRHYGEQIYIASTLRDLDHGGKPCQPSTHYDDFRIRHV